MEDLDYVQELICEHINKGVYSIEAWGKAIDCIKRVKEQLAKSSLEEE